MAAPVDSSSTTTAAVTCQPPKISNLQMKIKFILGQMRFSRLFTKWSPPENSMKLRHCTADPKTTMTRGKIQWTKPAMNQNFSLPPSIMYYIAMNPSTPKGYTKLIQTCKYFFERNSIIVASNMTVEKNIYSHDKCSRLSYGKCYAQFDISKFTSKIWYTRDLFLHQNNIPNFAELLRPKIYRCDIAELSIREQTVEFEDFKFFALSAKDIFLHKVEIVYKNSSPVMLENILEALSNIKNFDCVFKDNDSMVSSSTAKNISKIKNIGNLKKMKLWFIPEVFQIDDLLAFFKAHNGIKFRLHFASNISVHYWSQLNHLTDSLIDSQSSNVYISYRFQNFEKRAILHNRF